MNDEKIRDVILQNLKNGLLGPGSDIWGIPDEEEIISDYPLQRYFTGIVFPRKGDPKSIEEKDTDNAKTSLNESDDLVDDSAILNEPLGLEHKEDEEPGQDNKKFKNISNENDNDSNDNKNLQSCLHPSNIGLTFAVKTDVRKVNATFSFGIYSQLNSYKERKIHIDEGEFNKLIELDSFPFKNILMYESGFMSLSRDLEGNMGGQKQRDGEYSQYDKFKSLENIKERKDLKEVLNRFEKLISSRVWKRKPIYIKTEISIETLSFQLTHKSIKKPLQVFCNIKTFDFNDLRYVKIQLVNYAEQPSNRFSNRSEALNKKCLFQAKISIDSEKFKQYERDNLNLFEDKDLKDFEAEEISFVYRNIKSLAVGHNCSVSWSDNKKTIETTFMPEEDLKDFTNDIDDDENKICLKDLSIWGKNKNEVIKIIEVFCNSYNTWIESQEKNSKILPEKQKSIAERLIIRQNENFNRMSENINLLNNDNVFRAFQIANTAMYIQMIISNDNRFSKTEKELSDIIKDKNTYDNINFFKDYSLSPKYRPFQFAFFLLCLDSIVNPNENQRNIVDLLWFPTGGGKTEAYLAVTAFTIAYRRIALENWQGTTVIMRYTLRLLTAQQFERASRLISAMEFLRRSGMQELKNEPISIGLWIGQGSTPNKIEDAQTIVDEIKRSLNNKKPNAESENGFQITSCPWCGTKIISGNTQGFCIDRNNFVIKCINPECCFHDILPLQVVDDMIYKNPPTLLFATVDKFAALATKSEAHRLFNSQNDLLSPDLIIQDELHLISGPLGSIVGIYENIVELLCTKNGRKPKIIASTATTRNTENQVKNLYAERSVNIFPPAGISYDDNYFSKESVSESNRKYVGFLPTGKTGVDTEIMIISHLLSSRIKAMKLLENDNLASINNYWTIVSYYNSLKDVGRIHNKIGDEIKTTTNVLIKRIDPNQKYFGITNRTRELTSRWPSDKIKNVLKEMEKDMDKKSINSILDSSYNIESLDLILATNMISVGIDIKRLNIMLMNGIPKNTAEYIQASSRVGRSTKGLIITLFNPLRAREKSNFEHFSIFHKAFYKSVEPLSVTPFTENAIDKMIATMVVAFVRNRFPNQTVSEYKDENLNELRNHLKKRLENNSYLLKYLQKKIDELSDSWKEKIKDGLKNYQNLLINPSSAKEISDKMWAKMTSLRDVDTTTIAKIKNSFTVGEL